MKKQKVKPCPLCGHRKVISFRIISRRWYEKRRYCECGYCHFCAKSAYTECGAVRLWNKSTNIVRIGDEITN